MEVIARIFALWLVLHFVFIAEVCFLMKADPLTLLRELYSPFHTFVTFFVPLLFVCLYILFKV